MRVRAFDVTNQLNGDGAIYPKAINVKDGKKIDGGSDKLKSFDGANDVREGGGLIGGDWLVDEGYEGNAYQGNLFQEGENSRQRGKGSGSLAISESQNLGNGGLRIVDLSGRDFRGLTPDFNLSPVWNQLSNAELSEISMSSASDLNQQQPLYQLQPPTSNSISNLTKFGLSNNFTLNPSPSNPFLGFDNTTLLYNNTLPSIN